jgi:hypothetical protein
MSIDLIDKIGPIGGAAAVSIEITGMVGTGAAIGAVEQASHWSVTTA